MKLLNNIDEGDMDKVAFRKAVLFWAGLLVGANVLFPVVLVVLIVASGCPGGQGACGALAAVLGMVLKPIVVLVPLIGLLRAVFLRLRHLGMSLGWLGVIAFWLFASLPLLVAFGNFWGANFGLGIIAQPGLLTLLYPISLIVFLCFVETAGREEKPEGRLQLAWWGMIGALVHAMLLLGPIALIRSPLVMLFVGSPQIADAIRSLLQISVFATLGVPVLVVMFVNFLIFASCLFFIARHRTVNRPGPRRPSRGAGGGTRPPARIGQRSFGRS